MRLAKGLRICPTEGQSSMRPKGSRSPRSLLVIAIIVIVVIVDVDRAQVMREDPLGHVAALLAGLHVGKAEVDAFPDADVDYVTGRIREAVIRLPICLNSCRRPRRRWCKRWHSARSLF